MRRSRLLLPALIFSLAGCGTAPQRPAASITADIFRNEPMPSAAGQEVALYSLMLLRTGYKFGGKNPEAGLDCSGMVTHVYRQAAGLALEGNAATLAGHGRRVDPGELRAGDLLFFNTLGRPFSHVAIYLGRGEFIHAPNSRGSVRIDTLTNQYYAKRFEMARTLLD